MQERGSNFSFLILLVTTLILCQIPCIHLFCPYGYAFFDNPDYDYDDDYDYDTPPKICKKKEDGVNYNPMLWDHNDKVFLEAWENNKDFLLVGQKLIPENASMTDAQKNQKRRKLVG